MEYNMKLKTTIPVMVSTAAFLTACGGGDGNTIADSSQYKLSGTVPGTLIEAFCDNGSYHSVNSIHNGTGKHPFELTLPSNISCRVLMTTNEDSLEDKVVTPIKISQLQGASGIAFKSNDDLDLGHIDLALTRSNMKSDSNKDGVEDEPHEVELDSSESDQVEIKSDSYDPLDDDGDGIINLYEDDDDDHIPNKDDDDDDGDGIHDDEDDDQDNDGESDNDLDGDGVEDDEDSDDDNDGKEDDEDEDHDDDNNSDGGTNSDLVTTPSAGRLLASQCAQCHRTDANPDKGFEDLIGEEIEGDLVEMKRENKRELMHLQANGYSDEQIRLIDDYFNNLKGGE